MIVFTQLCQRAYTSYYCPITSQRQIKGATDYPHTYGGFTGHLAGLPHAYLTLAVNKIDLRFNIDVQSIPALPDVSKKMDVLQQ